MYTNRIKSISLCYYYSKELDHSNFAQQQKATKYIYSRISLNEIDQCNAMEAIHHSLDICCRENDSIHLQIINYKLLLWIHLFEIYSLSNTRCFTIFLYWLIFAFFKFYDMIIFTLLTAFYIVYVLVYFILIGVYVSLADASHSHDHFLRLRKWTESILWW